MADEKWRVVASTTTIGYKTCYEIMDVIVTQPISTMTRGHCAITGSVAEVVCKTVEKSLYRVSTYKCPQTFRIYHKIFGTLSCEIFKNSGAFCQARRELSIAPSICPFPSKTV